MYELGLSFHLKFNNQNLRNALKQNQCKNHIYEYQYMIRYREPTINKELRFLVFQSLIYIKALIFPVFHMSIPHWSQRRWRNASPFHKHNHWGPREGLSSILTKVYQHYFAIVIHATAIDRLLSFCHISPPPHLDQGRRSLQLLLLFWTR